jgi:DNA-binding response OmpR family regulator
MRALIVEPHVLTSFMIEDALKDAGFSSVSLATSEEEAVAMAEANPPDLVTVALRLRSGSGISALQQIRCKADPDVVFITRRVAEVQIEEPDAVIVRKPFLASHLRPAIAEAQCRTDPPTHV